MNSSDRDDLLERIGRLLASQRVGVLATQYRQTPHQSLIAYVGSDDLRDLFFITPLNTRKVAAMEEDPRVTFLVDNRENVESDFGGCIAVTARGTVERLDDRQRRPFLSGYLERHPYLEHLAAAPSSGSYAIRVRSYTVVSALRTVEELFVR